MNKKKIKLLKETNAELLNSNIELRNDIRILIDKPDSEKAIAIKLKYDLLSSLNKAVERSIYANFLTSW